MSLVSGRAACLVLITALMMLHVPVADGKAQYLWKRRGRVLSIDSCTDDCLVLVLMTARLSVSMSIDAPRLMAVSVVTARRGSTHTGQRTPVGVSQAAV